MEEKNFSVENLLGSLTGATEIEGAFDEFASLLSLDDEKFNVLKEVVLDEVERNLSGTSERYLLTKAIQEGGIDIDELSSMFEVMVEAIDEELKSYSDTKKDFLKRVIALVFNAINEASGRFSETLEIPIELIHEDAKMPTYANMGDAGMDIYAIEDITINPGETVLVKTGLKVAIPQGYELQVRPKSGRCLKTKLRVANSPGTIDSGYREEIGVIIENLDPPIRDIEYTQDSPEEVKIHSILHGAPFYITKGEKFAQLILNKVPRAIFFEVGNINEYEGDTRNGGFGSTGLK